MALQQSNNQNIISVSNSSITDVLLSQNIITKEQSQAISEESVKSGKPLEEIVLSGLFIDTDKIILAKSILYKIPFIKDLLSVLIAFSWMP
jgi:Ran GTPase-activating protein (RanGAP) involved in mRNA processing and transport